MSTIIREVSAIQGASLETLNATYRALRGEPDHPGFDALDAARPAVTMAILSAQNAAAARGIPVGTRPAAATPEELRPNPYAPGSISHRLHEAVHAQQPIAPRPAGAPAPARVTLHCVRATGTGTSRLQAASIRAAVLARIAAAPDATATVEALEEHFRHPVRGHLQKLLEKGHIVAVEVAA
jgi:hypothetical protein